jgi:hypothetical protein
MPIAGAAVSGLLNCAADPELLLLLMINGVLSASEAIAMRTGRR